MTENQTSSLGKLNAIIKKTKDISFYKSKIQLEYMEKETDVSRLPITTKEDLREISAVEMITSSKFDLYEYHESFGTTGIPVSTWLTKNDFNAYVNQLEETPFEMNAEDIVLIRFPYSISVPAHIFTEFVRRKGACVVPVSKATVIAPYPRVNSFLKKLDVTILCCMPQEAFILKAVALKMGLDLKKELKKLRALFVAGEMLSSSRKRRLEEEWGVPVYEFYGTTETGNLATSCELGKFHCSVNHFYFEALNYYDKSPVPLGEKGMLYVTTLSKENFPLLRYEVGDIVEMNNGCKCGNTAPVLHHHGRWQNSITYNGNLITQREIEEQIFTLPADIVSNFYRIISKKEGIEIHLESLNYEDSNILNKIESSITLDIPFKVRLFPVEGIQNISSLIEYDSYGKPAYFIKENE